MFQVQHEALRQAEREIDRLAARRRHGEMEPEQPGRPGLAGWLRRIWTREEAGRSGRHDEAACGPISGEGGA